MFQGVNKHNGETVAVKTFNQLSHMRPQEVQMREFEVCQHVLVQDISSLHSIHQVLEKVKHENIVKLLAIEEEQEGRGKVESLIRLLSGAQGLVRVLEVWSYNLTIIMDMFYTKRIQFHSNMYSTSYIDVIEVEDISSI